MVGNARRKRGTYRLIAAVRVLNETANRQEAEGRPKMQRAEPRPVKQGLWFELLVALELNSAKQTQQVLRYQPSAVFDMTQIVESEAEYRSPRLRRPAFLRPEEGGARGKGKESILFP